MHIELLNDAMRRKEFFATSSSHFAQDCSMVEWDTPGISVSDRFHSDITDAVLYGFRKCLHYLEQPKPTPVAKEKQEENALLEHALKPFREKEQNYDNYFDL